MSLLGKIQWILSFRLRSFMSVVESFNLKPYILDSSIEKWTISNAIKNKEKNKTFVKWNVLIHFSRENYLPEVRSTLFSFGKIHFLWFQIIVYIKFNFYFIVNQLQFFFIFISKSLILIVFWLIFPIFLFRFFLVFYFTIATCQRSRMDFREM